MRRSHKPPARTATQRAIGLLTRREHSRKELIRKLVAGGVDSGEASSAVAKLAEAAWQDDTRFAGSLIRTRAAAGYGPIRIGAELATHGLGREAIAAALEGVEIDWDGNARDLVGAASVQLPATNRAAREKMAANAVPPRVQRRADPPCHAAGPRRITQGPGGSSAPFRLVASRGLLTFGHWVVCASPRPHGAWKGVQPAPALLRDDEHTSPAQHQRHPH